MSNTISNTKLNSATATQVESKYKTDPLSTSERAVELNPTATSTDSVSLSGRSIMLSRLFGSSEAGAVAKPGSDNPLVAAYLTDEDRTLIEKMYDYSVKNGIDLYHVDALAIDLGTYRASPNLIRDADLYDLSGRKLNITYSEKDKALAEKIADVAPSSELDQGFLNSLQSPTSHSVNFEFLEKMVNVFSPASLETDTKLGAYDIDKNKLVVTVDDAITVPVPVANFSYDAEAKSWTNGDPRYELSDVDKKIADILNSTPQKNVGYLQFLLGFARSQEIDSTSFLELLNTKGLQ